MVKRIGRRFVSLLLTFVTILTMLPAMTLPALAAPSGTVTGLADQNIGLSFNGTADNAWSASSTQIIGKARSTSGSGCGGGSNYRSTLTIKNNKTTKATLSFDYTVVVSEGTILVNNERTTTAGSFSQELGAGGTVKVEIESGSTSADTMITMTNVKLVSDVNATATFVPAENGTYTVDGKLITEEYSNTQSSMTAYQVLATPAEGYRFKGWYDVASGKCISTDAKTALNFDSNRTITARFVSKELALFETGGQVFDDLGDAVSYAQANNQNKITLASDGKITGNYTIPSGVTLLIPFDEAETVYKETPKATRSEQPAATPFRTLTMVSGSSITLANGAAISVGGQYYAGAGGQKGQMVGPYGYIKMESGSAIDVQSGASLYAWGFISGSGSVTVKSGGSVYEWYQIMDFRGGSASSDMGNKVFPFSQYAVQNVEVPLTLHAGASETAYTAVYAIRKINPTSIPFIGNKGMFKLVSGSLTKAYDGATDRIIYTIDGVAEVNSLNLKLAGMNVSSSSYVLPLTNNMTVNLTQRSKLTVNQTAALLPGVEVSIAKGAELAVASGKSMYIYDMAQWGGYCGTDDAQYMSVVVAPGRTGKRAPLADVKVDVNGTLTAIGGIYTTAGGADICSSTRTGVYNQQDKPGTETKTYQYTQKGRVTEHEIPITAAKLHNADDTYTETANASAGQTIPYCTCPTCGGKWLKDFAAIINSTDNKTTYHPTLQEAVKQFPQDSNGNTYIKMLHSTTEDIPTENITTNKDLYLDLNGCTVKGDISVTDNHKLYGIDSSAKADYTTAPTGKIVGTVTGYAPTYQTPGDTNDCYVAIQGKEADNETTNLSFHRFNISVTGYRFELKAPECALFFIGKFQGDEAAKKYLTSLGFTLKGEDGRPLGEDNYELPADKDIPPEAEPGDSPVVRSGDAFLFEVYLKRSFEKDKPAAYTEKIIATAQAMFKNNGTQDSEPKQWSFEDAWTNPGELDPAQKEILKKFFNEFGINIQVE
jgi:hypothetical protein